MGMGAGGSTATPIPTPTTASCPSTEVTRTPLRRLTRFEYANSVKSILGVDAAPAAALPVDEVTDGFSNNAEVLTVSPLHAEKYVRTCQEEYGAARPKHKAVHLVALTRVMASQQSVPAPGYEEARKLLTS